MGKEAQMLGGGLKFHLVQLWAGGCSSYMAVIELAWIIWDKAAEPQGGEPMRRLDCNIRVKMVAKLCIVEHPTDIPGHFTSL